jgi:hypothetical protein
MLRLFTTFYEDARPERMEDYTRSARRNVLNESIDELCVMAEGDTPSLPTAAKVKLRKTPRRPTYADFFAWINEVVDVDDISIIANTDISFDTAIGVLNRGLGPSECFAVARWDGDRLFYRNDSQDWWAFRGIVKKINGGFELGAPRCDNRLMHELRIAGYQVLNPAFSIKAQHAHAGAREEYEVGQSTGYVQPPYEYLWPHNLWSLPRTLIHNSRRPSERVRWRFDRRRLAATAPFRLASRIGRVSAGAFNVSIRKLR